MKIIVFALAAAAFATVASAQDEAQSPAPGDNPPSSSLSAPSTLRDSSPSSSTSSASESVSPAATPKPAPAASASPKASAASPKKASESTEHTRARKQEDEEEEPAPKGRNAVADSAGPDRGSPEGNVKRLENNWEMAVRAHDPSFLQARVAEDFIGVSSRGKRLNKSSLIKEFRTDSDTYSTAKNTGIVIRMIDKDVVVASGVAKEVGRTRDGRPFKRSYIWTDTWALRDDRWECVASHVMQEPGT